MVTVVVVEAVAMVQTVMMAVTSQALSQQPGLGVTPPILPVTVPVVCALGFCAQHSSTFHLITLHCWSLPRAGILSLSHGQLHG